MAGHLGTAGSTCPQVLLSVKTEAPAKYPPLCWRLSPTLAPSTGAAVPWVGNLHHAVIVGLHFQAIYQEALRPADAATLMGMDCIRSVYIVQMLPHLHELHEADKADIEFVHLPLVVCIQDASKQHSLLRGYSCLQNIQATHQHHTRHVAYRYLCTTCIYSDTIPGLLAQLHAMQPLPCQ